jgi:hypothetical protein
MIELIIALAISMVIVMGVGSLYFSSSGISRTANQMGSLEEAGQIAMRIIGESLRLGGYGEVMGSDYVARDQTLFDGPHIRACPDGQRFADPFPVPPAVPNYSCVATGTPGDALMLSFQANSVLTVPQGELRNCLGNGPTDELVAPTELRVGSGLTRPTVRNVFQMDGANQLTCRADGAGFQPLILNVVDFRVFFGFDDEAYAAAATGFTNASPLGGSIRDPSQILAFAVATPAIDPWDYVVAVHVCLTVRSAEAGVGTLTTPARCPQTPAEAATGVALTDVGITDGMARRTYRQVYTVRSRATSNPSIQP